MGQATSPCSEKPDSLPGCFPIMWNKLPLGYTCFSFTHFLLFRFYKYFHQSFQILTQHMEFQIWATPGCRHADSNMGRYYLLSIHLCQACTTWHQPLSQTQTDSCIWQPLHILWPHCMVFALIGHKSCRPWSGSEFGKITSLLNHQCCPSACTAPICQF